MVTLARWGHRDYCLEAFSFLLTYMNTLEKDYLEKEYEYTRIIHILDNQKH